MRVSPSDPLSAFLAAIANKPPPPPTGRDVDDYVHAHECLLRYVIGISLRHFTPLTVRIEDPPCPHWWRLVDENNALASFYENIPRYTLIENIALGYSGDGVAEIIEPLRDEVLLNLFVEWPVRTPPTPDRELPFWDCAHPRFRIGSAMLFHAAKRCALFEIYALFSLAEKDPVMAGVFKRAARMSLNPIVRAFATRKLPRIVPRSRESKDNLVKTLTVATGMLHTALQYAKSTEEAFDFDEQWTPAEHGEFTFDPLEASPQWPAVQFRDLDEPSGILSQRTHSIPSPAGKGDRYSPDWIRTRMKSVFRHTVERADDSANAENFDNSQNAFWERGAFYTGVMAAYRATDDAEYLDQAVTWSESNRWRLAENRLGYRFADNMACAQTYLELYLLQGGEEKIAHVKSVVDDLFDDPPPGRELWWWCDALYMAPPVFALLAKATGDDRYWTLMDRLYRDAREFLYDSHVGLFYRDKNYFPDEKRTATVRKIFWSRGNGWVLGGLARVLEHMPESHPLRPEYVALFRHMIQAVLKFQNPDGLWRSFLTDPKAWPMPETSGSAFFCFALWWGIATRVLSVEKAHRRACRAWEGLNRLVRSDGRLGWVQFVAAAPGPVSPRTMREYAPGAYLLSAAEILRSQNVDIDFFQ